MNKKIIILIILPIIIIILIFGTFNVCYAHQLDSIESTTSYPVILEDDKPLILPDWDDGDYHDYYKTREKLLDFNDNFSSLVSLFSIGKSVLNKDIWCIKITNENNVSNKLSCLYDGCIHGNEWEGGEACLYFAEYLLINFGKNETITNILNKSEIYIVPLVNPDGRQKDDRFNNNGIDLNRNFDVHFGRLRGWSIPLGKIFGFIKIKYIWFPLRGYFVTNCGRYPFSEPESKAMADFMEELRYHDFSFYLSLHTATHVFGALSNDIIRPEYELSQREINIFKYAKSWVENNTEYRQAKDNDKYGFGSSTSYCFKECHIPTFWFEPLTNDYDPYFWHGKHDHLVHWMNTTLPVFMYLLVNIENLHNWNTPNIEPTLPDGVPPTPLK